MEPEPRSSKSLNIRNVRPARSFAKFSELKNFRKLSIQYGAPPELYTTINLTIPWTYDGTSDRQIIEVIHLNRTSLTTLNVAYYECGLIHLFSLLSVSAPILTQLSINCYGPIIKLRTETSLDILPNLKTLKISFSPFNQQYQAFHGALVKLFTALPNLETIISNRKGASRYQSWFHDFVIGEMTNLKLCPKLQEFQTSITEFTPLQLMTLLKRKEWIKKLTLHFNPNNSEQINITKPLIAKFLQGLSNAKTLQYLELDWQHDEDSGGMFPIEKHKFEKCLLSIHLCSWNSTLEFLESLKSLEELTISFANNASNFICAIYKENRVRKLSVDNWNFKHEDLNRFLQSFPNLTDLRINLNPKLNIIQEIQSNTVVFQETLNILELDNWNGQNYDFLASLVNLKTLIIRLQPSKSSARTNFPIECTLGNTLINLTLSQFNTSLGFINSFSSLQNLWLTFNDFNQGIFQHEDNYEDFNNIFSNLKDLESIHLYKNLGQEKITNNTSIMNFLSNVKVDLM